MAINITSNTDTEEQVMAAMGGLSQSKPVEESSEAAQTNETDESTEESETSENDDSEENESKDGEEKPKKKGGYQRRIAKLNSKLSEKDREVEYWKNQAIKPSKNEQVEAKPSNEGRPKADDFETHEDYVEALTDWKLDTKLSEQKKQASEDNLKREYDSKFKSHAERVQTFAKDHDDFQDAIDDIDDILLPIVVQDIIVNSDNGPELMYELAKNREELERICSLSPIAAAREIGKFEAKLGSSESKKIESKPVTKAPKPISPVNSSKAGGTKKSISDPNLSQSEYERLRREQIRAAQA